MAKEDDEDKGRRRKHHLEAKKKEKRSLTDHSFVTALEKLATGGFVALSHNLSLRSLSSPQNMIMENDDDDKFDNDTAIVLQQ